ncbi:MAG: site-2 protease family protein [Thermoplasmatales archaeon]
MDDIETIRVRVGNHFIITKESKIQDGVYEFYVLSDPNLEANFKSLVSDLKGVGYIPVVTKNKEGGSELVISVIKRRKSRPFGLWVNIVLLIATLISTIYVGEQLYVEYFGITKFQWFLYLDGFVYFSLPLLIILTSHELGHFFVARRNGVSASLPFFIPAPFTILGTLGAFISLRDPLPDRKTLIKIGAAGPIVGFVMSIIVGVVGAYLGSVQKPVQVTSSQVSYMISLPLIYSIIPPIQTTNVHPVAFAAWVGFLVTAINLFPIGQLDGGHVARGLLGQNSKYLSYAFIILLILLGIYYLSWILFAIIVIILGLSHPPPLNDISKPSRKELLVGIVAIALVAVSFSPVPLVEQIEPNHMSIQLVGGNNFVIYNASQYSYDNFTLLINNMNNYTIPLSIGIKAPSSLAYSGSYEGVMQPNERRLFNVSIWPSGQTLGGSFNFTIKVTASTKKQDFERNVTIVTPDRNLTVITKNYIHLPGLNPVRLFDPESQIEIINNGPDAMLEVFKFNMSSNFNLNGSLETSGNGTFIYIPANSSAELNITFVNPYQESGIILLDNYNLWNVLALFYVPGQESSFTA